MQFVYHSFLGNIHCLKYFILYLTFLNKVYI